MIDNLKRIGVELRDLDRPEQAAVVYHDLGLNFDDLSDARRSSLAYRRASRLLDKLAQSNPSGPAWVARISRLAGIEALLLSALARGRPPVASIVRMARSFGRDADDALVQRSRRPNGLDGVTLNEQDELKFAKVLRSIGAGAMTSMRNTWSWSIESASSRAWNWVPETRETPPVRGKERRREGMASN